MNIIATNTTLDPKYIESFKVCNFYLFNYVQSLTELAKVIEDVEVLTLTLEII